MDTAATLRSRRDAINLKPWPAFQKSLLMLHVQPETEGGGQGFRSCHPQAHNPSAGLSICWDPRWHTGHSSPVAPFSGPPGIVPVAGPVTFLLSHGLSSPPIFPSAFPAMSHPFPCLFCLHSSQQTPLWSRHPHVHAVYLGGGSEIWHRPG